MEFIMPPMNLTTQYVQNGQGISVKMSDILIIDKNDADCKPNCQFGDSCYSNQLSDLEIVVFKNNTFKIPNSISEGY